MSTIVRILVMALAWLVFFLVTFYGCIKPTCCGNAAATETTTVVPPVEAPATADYAIASRLNDPDVLTGDDWDALRNDLLERYRANPEQTLQIFGNYYESEVAPEGYANMGLARADRLKQLLVPDIPEDKIELGGRLLSSAVPSAEELWRAGSFDWTNTGETDEDDVAPEIIEISETEIRIRFPFNADSKTIAPDVDEYLRRLAQRLQQTNERVTIVGHTDYIDTEAFNMRLGQRRADFVRDILVENGAPADRITTSSRGENDPEATNETAEGRRKNRRAVVNLIGE